MPRTSTRPKIGACDFETNQDVNDCHVWLWDICELDSLSHITGRNMSEFIEAVVKYGYTQLYFHNEKFDGQFILDYLIRAGWTYCANPAIVSQNQFDILRSDRNVLYSITLYCDYYKNGKLVKRRINIWDSLKKIPGSVEEIAKSYKLPILKGSIDYDLKRPIGYQPTKAEIDYIHNDTEIIARVLKIQYENGLDSMTIGSDAIKDCRRRVGASKWDKLFPNVSTNKELDEFIRESYSGGFVWVNPKIQGKDVGSGVVYDNNSMHPSQLRYKLMPYGWPKTYDGPYVQDDEYPLYIQHIVLTAKIKPGRIPCIALGRSMMNHVTEYLYECEEHEMICTSVDWDLIQQQYDIIEVEFIEGLKFKAQLGMFNDYIDYWIDIKANSTGSVRQIAKLMLNNVYGKFGARREQQSAIPYLDEETDTVKYHVATEPDETRWSYLPVACFTTAYSRHTLITAGQAIGLDRLCYCDTDSLHILGDKVPDIEIHESKLGAWKEESKFTRARFLRPKRYCEDHGGEIEFKCGGMPKNVKAMCTWENFHTGQEFFGKLMPVICPGGTVLVPTTYKMS